MSEAIAPQLTRRLVNPGAEHHMLQPFRVLDKGRVTLVDYMGRDETVVAAARHSYGKEINLDDHVGNERLINFLMRERHTSPFEQAEMAFLVKAPIFVFRQWQRHRTANLNEASGRYMELVDEWYVPQPDEICEQSTSSKQGSGGVVAPFLQELFLERQQTRNRRTFKDYRSLIECGVAKETARIDLPLSTYSIMVWKIDLHNLLHFLNLRLSPHAQGTIRKYADVIATIVKDSYPKVWAAFEEHVLHAVTLSRTERQRLHAMLKNWTMDKESLKIVDKLRLPECA